MADRMWSSFCILTLLQLHRIVAYPYGAPTQACEGMSPDHGSLPQTVDSQYLIRPTAVTYCPKNEVNVTLTGTVPFRGFICQARSSVNGFDTTGSLTSSENDVGRTTNNCAGKASLTHKDPMKKTSVNFKWTPDSSITDKVYIVCTIVQHKTTYWVKQYIEMDYAGANQCSPDGDVRGLPTSCSDSATCDTQFTSSVCDTTADADGQCICPSDMEVADPTHTYCSPKGLPKACSDRNSCDVFFKWSICDADADDDGHCVCPSNMKIADASDKFCSPKTLNDVCTSTSDCAGVANAECIEGRCKLNVCTANTDCTGTNGNQCVEGKCTSACTANTDCTGTNGNQCVEGKCTSVCTANTDCTGTNGNQCVEGKCTSVCTANTDCTGTNGNQCVEGKCTSGASCTLFSMISLVVCGLFLYCQNVINS